MRRQGELWEGGGGQVLSVYRVARRPAPPPPGQGKKSENTGHLRCPAFSESLYQTGGENTGHPATPSPPSISTWSPRLSITSMPSTAGVTNLGQGARIYHCTSAKRHSNTCTGGKEGGGRSEGATGSREGSGYGGGLEVRGGVGAEPGVEQ